MAFIRFLVALSALIALSILSKLYTPEGYRLIASLGILIILVPMVSYTLGDFAKKCYTEEGRKKSPFLYSIGMFLGVPQKVLGIICLIVGVGWVYGYLNNSIQLSIPTVVFTFALTIFGLTWFINALLAGLKDKK